MFSSLTQFYNSNEWKSLRQTLIDERKNKEDGILYCEFSREPILNEWEAIGHHITPITMQNVNDYNISLNPANIMIVSHKSHNIIHKRFEGQLSSWQRKVYIVFGAPCSGKSTFVNNNMSKGDLRLDLDEIWHALGGEAAHNYPAEIKPVIFGVREYLLQQIKMRAGKWGAAWVLSTEPLITQQNRLIDSLGAEAIYIDTSKELCLERLYKNPDGRDINLFSQLINDFYQKKELYS
jgi:predicted kinase